MSATPTTTTAATRTEPARAGAWRWLAASGVAVAMGGAALGLLRVDADIGAPAGPDRRLAAIDRDAVVTPADVASARAILQTRPIDGSADRVLAESALAHGDKAKADALYAIALRRAPRDLRVRAHLIDASLADGDLQAALGHMDALLRVAPALASPVAARLLPQLGVPGLREALVARLQASPPWRPVFIRGLLADAVDPAAAEALLADLAGRTPLTVTETRVHVDLLDRLGDYARARALWLATEPAGQGAVFDGGFELASVDGAYSWRLPTAPGVAVGQDMTHPAQGTAALALAFSGRAVRLDGPAQWLALAPGRYRLAYATDNQTRTTRPFYWQIACRDGDHRVLLRAELPAATPGWVREEASFTVPAGCAGQNLSLGHAARTLLERRISGVLRVDGVDIGPN